ncbi:homer protein homolog 1b isoform X1 [Pleuronectes platessa]|uniref:homer protein homolog 1b isoform X1 n=1 Tax=Pleuronectes platessa TaxID=8262 RepID=UPI00232A4328|nr:homer protein homolog 1b isoform X1 [Pleuronectes platessa]
MCELCCSSRVHPACCPCIQDYEWEQWSFDSLSSRGVTMEDCELEIRLPGRSDSPLGHRRSDGGGGHGGGFGETLVLRHKEVHHFFFAPFREQPIYSTRAHVFQIDPNTKKNWLPTSKHAVTVSYFYDSTRNVYRIISLDGTKAIINSTISPNMTFTKTSQKFGQWADSRANTVYGLGFSTEHHLAKFAEKFAEYKEAARLAKEKSQEKDMATSPSQESPAGELSSPLTPLTPPMETINGTDDICDSTPNSDSRPEPSQNALAFTHSPAMTKHWEAELDALKGNNAKLTAALLESTANVKQWKQQLAAYQEEAERLHKRVTELECQSSQSPAIKSQKTELNQTIEELENTLRDKEEEMEKLKEELENMNDLMEQKDTLTQKLEETDLRSRVLEEQLAGAEQRLEENQEEQENFRKSLRTLLEMLDGKIFELTELRDTLARLIEEAS